MKLNTLKTIIGVILSISSIPSVIHGYYLDKQKFVNHRPSQGQGQIQGQSFSLDQTQTQGQYYNRDLSQGHVKSFSLNKSEGQAESFSSDQTQGQYQEDSNSYDPSFEYHHLKFDLDSDLSAFNSINPTTSTSQTIMTPFAYHASSTTTATSVTTIFTTPTSTSNAVKSYTSTLNSPFIFNITLSNSNDTLTVDNSDLKNIDDADNSIIISFLNNTNPILIANDNNDNHNKENGHKDDDNKGSNNKDNNSKDSNNDINNKLESNHSDSSNRKIEFAPYVDITLYPTMDLAEIMDDQGIDSFIISFIVTCIMPSCPLNGPSFGGTIGIGQDEDSTGSLSSINSSIEKFKSKGGKIIISFGGAINDELALHHDQPETLADAYKKVIDTYHPVRLDFDMEGTSLMDDVAKGRSMKEVHEIRAKALTILKKELGDQFPEISLCLPVNPDIGLDDHALTIINIMKENDLPLDLISIMAMDYGASYKDKGFYINTMNALKKAYDQSKVYYPDIKMGVIPMIGENDDGAILSLEEAERLVKDIKEKKEYDYVRMLSMWSINRDRNDGSFDSLIKNTFKSSTIEEQNNSQENDAIKSSFAYSSIFKKYI